MKKFKWMDSKDLPNLADSEEFYIICKWVGFRKGKLLLKKWNKRVKYFSDWQDKQQKRKR